MSKKSERANRLANLYAVLARAKVNEDGNCVFELDEVNSMLEVIKDVLALDGIRPL